MTGYLNLRRVTKGIVAKREVKMLVFTMSELFTRSLMGWAVFLLLLAVGQAAVPFKTIYKSIKPFNLTTTTAFDEATFKKNNVEFDTFSRYEAIEIGGDKVSASKDEDFRKGFHETLSNFFSGENADFVAALKKVKKADFENMEKVVKSGATAADKYNAVYTKFFMKKDVVDAIVTLFNSKIFFSLKEMSEWTNSTLIDTLIGIDILGINGMRKVLGKKELAKEEVKKAILESKRKSFVNLVVAMMKIPTSNKTEWYTAFFNLFDGMKDNDFLEDCMFSDKFDNLTTKKSITGTEYLDVIFPIMTTKLGMVTTVKKVVDLKKLDTKVKDATTLTKFRMRKSLIANNKYFDIDVTPELVLRAFNLKPSTWANLAVIQKALNEIVLLTAATQIERFAAVLERSKSKFEGFSATSADELRNAFFNKKGLVLGNDNIFIKMMNESKRTIFDTAEDLSVGECISLKKFFKESDFFGFLAQYAFYKNFTFDLSASVALFTDQQQSEAYREVNFSKLIVALGTLKIKSINDLTKQLAPLVASSKKFPDLGILESLKYSLGDLKKKDASVVLTDIYNFTVDYFVTNARSVATLKVKNYSSRLELFLFFASPFKTTNNIFKKQLTAKQIQDEQFNNFNATIATQSLIRINANLDEAKRIFMTFITCDVFIDYYNSLPVAKKISKLPSFTVLSFINNVDDIITAIVSFGSEDVKIIASGSVPACFDVFVAANFFAIPITDAASLKKNICFMLEMKNMLNGIDVLNGIDSRVQLWSSLSLITDPKSIYMQQAERKPVADVLKVTASNDEYMAVLREAFKVFIPILNQSIKTEKISNEKGLKDFFEKNGKEFFSPWIDSLVALKLFGISPTHDTLDCKLAIKKYESESSQKLSKKITEVATSLELSENEILSFLPRLTQETSRIWYDQMAVFQKPASYSAAITLFLAKFEALLNYLVEKAGDKKGAEAKSEIELLFKSRPINADVLFSKNFFKLKDYSTEQRISEDIVKITLGFVVEDIASAFSEAGVLINDAGMLAASSNDKFFEDSASEELKTAWNEFKNEKTLVLRIRKLAIADDNSFVKLFIAAWKATLIKPADVIKADTEVSLKSGTSSKKHASVDSKEARFVDVADLPGEDAGKLKLTTGVVIDTTKKDESVDKIKLTSKAVSVAELDDSVKIGTSEAKKLTTIVTETKADGTAVKIDKSVDVSEDKSHESKKSKADESYATSIIISEPIIKITEPSTKKSKDGIEDKSRDSKIHTETVIIADTAVKADGVAAEESKKVKIPTETSITTEPVIKTEEKDADKSKKTKLPIDVVTDVDAAKKGKDKVEFKVDSEKMDVESSVKSSTKTVSDIDSKIIMEKKDVSKTDTVSEEKGKKTILFTEPEITPKKGAEIKKDSGKKDVAAKNENPAEKKTDSIKKVAAVIKKTEIPFDDSTHPKKYLQLQKYLLILFILLKKPSVYILNQLSL